MSQELQKEKSLQNIGKKLITYNCLASKMFFGFMFVFFNDKIEARCQWLTLVILAILLRRQISGGSQFEDSLGK
jgi:hypothetical protein